MLPLRIRPGSWVATYHFGCKCDMIRNQFGLGIDLSGQATYFDIAPECPIHVDAAGTIDLVEVIRRGAEIRRTHGAHVPIEGAALKRTDQLRDEPRNKRSRLDFSTMQGRREKPPHFE